MKKNVMMILALTFAFILTQPAEAQKIRTVDGVQVISNGKKPKAPRGVSTKISLTEEMTFGGGDDPDKAFAEVTAFVVDDSGTLYALDFKDRKVKVFDQNGNFQRLIGRQGQGPGEFNMPAGIHLNPDKELLVEDAINRRVAYFTLDGRFIKNVSTADRLGLVNLLMDGQGFFLGRELGLDGDKMFFEIKKFDKDLKPLFSLDKIEFAIPVPGTKMNPMDLASIFQFDGEGNIYYSRNLDYSIKILDPDGTHVRTIQRDYAPVKITQDDIDKILERIPNVAGSPVNIRDMFEFPKFFSPFQFFLLDEQGRLYVRTWEKGKDDEDYLIDVFDIQGRFIAQFPSKIDMRLWKDGKLYGLVDTDDGLRVIKRFSTAWN